MVLNSVSRSNTLVDIAIGLGGDNCSGKTSLANAFAALSSSGSVEVISLDGYHKETRKQRLQSGTPAADPDSNRLDLARGHLAALRAGQSVEVPTYDHTRGDFGPPRRIEPAGIILWEGLHALYPVFHDLLDLRVFLAAEPHLKRRWRMHRDVQQRGYDPDVLKKWLDHRDPFATMWIDPQRSFADVLLQYEAPGEDLCLQVQIAGSIDAARMNAQRNVYERLSGAVPNLDSALDYTFTVPVSWGDVRVPARVMARAGYKWATLPPHVQTITRE